MHGLLVAAEPPRRKRRRWLALLLVPWLFVAEVPGSYRWQQAEETALLAEGPAYAVALGPKEVKSLVRLWPDLVIASLRTGVPVQDIAVVMLHESGGQVNAYNPLGPAYGLMQLLPGTARSMAAKLGLPWSPQLLVSAQANLEMGAQYLADQHARFGSWRAAFAAYYGGPGSLEQSGVGPGTPWSQAAALLNWIPNPKANTITMTAYAEGMAASTVKVLAKAQRHRLWVPGAQTRQFLNWLRHPQQAPAKVQQQLARVPANVMPVLADWVLQAMAHHANTLAAEGHQIGGALEWLRGNTASALEGLGLPAGVAAVVATALAGVAALALA